MMTVNVLWLSFTVPWVGLQCVIVVFLDHTHFFKIGIQGSYRQDCVKFKDFSRTSQGLSYCFQGLKT